MDKRQLTTAVRVSAASLSLGFAAASLSANAADLKAIVTGGGTHVSEPGAVDHYTLALTEKPEADVIITFVLDGQLLVYPRAVKFQPDTFNVPQTITVSAVNDETPEPTPHAGTIRHAMSSTDPDFNHSPDLNSPDLPQITVSISDDDLASVTVTQSGGDSKVTEGGAQDSYTLALSMRPVAEVTIAVRRVAPDGQQPGPAEGSAQLSVSPASVTFTQENWQLPQTITLTAVNDAKVDGTQTETLAHAVSSSDTAYSQISIDSIHNVEVSIADDDSPGVLLSETGGATRVVEGGAPDSYTLVLASEPETYVSVTLVAGDPEQVTVTPPRVTFTPTNYATPQTITVSAVDDSFGEGPHAVTIAHSVSSGDLAYQGVTADPDSVPPVSVNPVSLPPVSVRITDNDVPAVLVSDCGGSCQVAEGGAIDSYTLVLTTRPADEVAIDIRPGSQLSTSPAHVSFSPENYATPQTVTLKALDDLVVEDTQLDTVTHTVSSADFGYHGIAADSVIATVADNDVRGVALSETGGSTQVTEGAAGGDRYSIALSAQPLSDVTITITPDAQLGASPASLTFTPDNFAAPQTVTVHAVDDDVAGGRRMAAIRHSASSGDAGYSGIQVSTISVTITDDDVAAVLLEESDSATGVAESGGSDSYTLRLATQPLVDVTISVNAGSQLQASPSTLTFTAADYNVPQTITVSAVDDTDVEGAHLGTIIHQVSSEDSAYNGIRELTVEIADNDVAATSPPATQQGDAASQGGGGGGSLSWTTLVGLLLGFCPLLICVRKGQG